MTALSLRIKPVNESSLEKVLPLIKKYQGFYGAFPNAVKTKSFFLQLIRNRSKGILLAAFNTEGAAIGFATLYFIPSSLSVQTTCLLNDLYTTTNQRGKGVARTLLQACREHALARGFKRLEWQTQESNKTAQRLYDQMSASKSRWSHYSMRLE